MLLHLLTFQTPIIDTKKIRKMVFEIIYKHIKQYKDILIYKYVSYSVSGYHPRSLYRKPEFDSR